MTGHDGNSSSKAKPLLAAEAALYADVADAAPVHALFLHLFMLDSYIHVQLALPRLVHSSPHILTIW